MDLENVKGNLHCQKVFGLCGLMAERLPMMMEQEESKPTESTPSVWQKPAMTMAINSLESSSETPTLNQSLSDIKMTALLF